MTNTNTKIFITNLGKYNEGELIGEWVTLTATDEEFKAVYNRIGINEQYEEWFITDYNTDINGLEIGEYDSIDDLNEFVETLEGLGETEKEAVEAMLEEGFDFEEAIEKAKDGDYIIYFNCNDMEDVAREYAEETGILNDVPENLQYYFDFESLGRDMSFEGQFVFINNDCIQIL